MKHRGKLSVQERVDRSRLCQLIGNREGFMHGSLIKMARTCGKATCKCQTQEAKHESYYIGQTCRRKTRMQAVPRQLEDRVRQWIANYQNARKLLEQLSDECWRKLRDAKTGR